MGGGKAIDTGFIGQAVFDNATLLYAPLLLIVALRVNGKAGAGKQQYKDENRFNESADQGNRGGKTTLRNG